MVIVLERFFRAVSVLVIISLAVLIQRQAFAVTNSSIDNDANKTVDELLDEASMLFGEARPLDARSKLIKALAVSPNDYRPHMLLGTYYLSEVAHFRLAYRYLQTAEKLFKEKYGTEFPGEHDRLVWQQHARLLYLLAETRLNLDDYEGSLKTLDEFGSQYWDSWYPGTRAWVLMKLKRLDEAIQVAQSGLILGADSGRTYNILGILLSLKESRELALSAFSQAIAAELSLGGSGQAATPLNNSGEVYRELFADDMAEASWLRALQMPDGCEHVLPSLNLAVLYIDHLRLFQARRALDDFRACFAQNPLRSDSEHRALLSLIDGRVALRLGDLQSAFKLVSFALEQEQSFGKIGTNEADLRFAATKTMAQVLQAKVNASKDIVCETLSCKAKKIVDTPLLLFRAWWLERRAREIAIDELDNFVDLFIRNTDTMLEYPTLSAITSGFPYPLFKSRIQRMLREDSRKHASTYYKLYLASNMLANYRKSTAIELLNDIKSDWRTVDRLARAQTLAKLEKAKSRNWSSIFTSESKEEVISSYERRMELFSLLPSHIRYYNFLLPVLVELNQEASASKKNLNRIKKALVNVRFEDVPFEFQNQTKYRLIISSQENSLMYTIALIEYPNIIIAQVSGEVQNDGSGMAELVNNFIEKAFSHRVDPPSAPVPQLRIFENLRNMG
jgi:tetratricopeptide (TPR) repeat protein